jgi:hypothetical protein
MTLISLRDGETTGQLTGAGLYSANLLKSANTGEPWFDREGIVEDGMPTPEILGALAQLGITHVRFPGGQEDEAFVDGILIDGDLPPFLRTFLEASQSNGLTVSLVIPVTPPSNVAVSSATTISEHFLEQVETFARLLAQDFSGTVLSVELGNEYWRGRELGDESLEVSYGKKASEVAVAFDRGQQSAGATIDIFLQAAGNLRQAFDNDLDAANIAIQSSFGITESAIDAVDGVVRNSYWKDADSGAFDNDSGLFKEDRALPQNFSRQGPAGWEDWAGKELQFMVGEYNLKPTYGLRTIKP